MDDRQNPAEWTDIRIPNADLEPPKPVLGDPGVIPWVPRATVGTSIHLIRSSVLSRFPEAQKREFARKIAAMMAVCSENGWDFDAVLDDARSALADHMAPVGLETLGDPEE